MNRFGFEKIYIDSFIKSIFVYTGKKSKLINYYDKCRMDLKAAERTRKIQILKNIVKKVLPFFLIKIIKKIRYKKINY